MTKNKVSQKERKTNVLVGFTQGEIAFLDRKIDKNFNELSSRSGILRLLVYRAMVHPELLDVRFEKES
jgi:hypothetical protein